MPLIGNLRVTKIIQKGPTPSNHTSIKAGVVNMGLKEPLSNAKYPITTKPTIKARKTHLYYYVIDITIS